MKYILSRCGGVRGALYGMVEGVPLVMAVMAIYLIGVMFA